jgi:hypothetical protein
MLRLVQLCHPIHGRRIALVDEPQLRLISHFTSVYDAALAAIRGGQWLEQLLACQRTEQSLAYDDVYDGRGEWSLLSPFDHPGESTRCFVTGTGLTHKASAENRQSMHGSSEIETDSMKMYRIGLEGGRPQPGCIGAPPEWFYKGTGCILRAHGQPLDVPEHGEDGGEESEIAGCYVVADDGRPFRVGLAQGNEFSDHVMEAQNYLYLAQSKLRSCALGPEIVVGGEFGDVPGEASLQRAGQTFWRAPLASGEKWMCHSLSNLEHHHFKHAEHRRPGDAHIHFFGADMFSFKDRIRLEDGDEMIIAFEGFGRPLRNPIRMSRAASSPIAVGVL